MPGAIQNAGHRVSEGAHHMVERIHSVHIPYHPTHAGEAIHNVAHRVSEAVRHPAQHVHAPHMHMPDKLHNMRRPSLASLHLGHHRDNQAGADPETARTATAPAASATNPPNGAPPLPPPPSAGVPPPAIAMLASNNATGPETVRYYSPDPNNQLPYQNRGATGDSQWTSDDMDEKNDRHPRGHPVLCTGCMHRPWVLAIERHMCWNGPRHKNGDDKLEAWYHHLWRHKWFLYLMLALSIIIIAVVAGVSAKLAPKHHDDPDGFVPPSNNSAPADSTVREVLSNNFPDPSLFYDNGTWYVFATNEGAGPLVDQGITPPKPKNTENIQMATSDNFANWTLTDSANPLPSVGAWAVHGQNPANMSKANVWAPSIVQRPSDGAYVMYYSAASANATERRHCIGAAVATTDSPAGPYSPLPDALACPLDQGGAIDSDAFIDKDNQVYVTYKIDGNSMGHGGSCSNGVAPQVDTPIMIQAMESDGVTKKGEPTAVLNREESDGPLIEAPSLVRSEDGTYFLFFSSGCTREASYNVKYATASDITGPYTRAAEILIQTGDWGLEAPGSCDVKPDPDGGFVIAFHARVWDADKVGVRAMFTSKIELEGTTATITAPPKSDDAIAIADSSLSPPAGSNATAASASPAASSSGIEGMASILSANLATETPIAGSSPTGSSAEVTPSAAAFGAASVDNTDSADSRPERKGSTFTLASLSPGASAGLDTPAGQAMAQQPGSSDGTGSGVTRKLRRFANAPMDV